MMPSPRPLQPTRRRPPRRRRRPAERVRRLDSRQVCPGYQHGACGGPTRRRDGAERGQAVLCTTTRTAASLATRSRYRKRMPRGHRCRCCGRSCSRGARNRSNCRQKLAPGPNHLPPANPTAVPACLGPSRAMDVAVRSMAAYYGRVWSGELNRAKARRIPASRWARLLCESARRSAGGVGCGRCRHGGF